MELLQSNLSIECVSFSSQIKVLGFCTQLFRFCNNQVISFSFSQRLPTMTSLSGTVDIFFLGDSLEPAEKAALAAGVADSIKQMKINITRLKDEKEKEKEGPAKGKAAAASKLSKQQPTAKQQRRCPRPSHPSKVQLFQQSTLPAFLMLMRFL